MDCSNRMVGAVYVAIRRWASGTYWIVLMYKLMLYRWCMHCTWRFRRSTAGFGFGHLFSARYAVYGILEPHNMRQ